MLLIDALPLDVHSEIVLRNAFSYRIVAAGIDYRFGPSGCQDNSANVPCLSRNRWRRSEQVKPDFRPPRPPLNLVVISNRVACNEQCCLIGASKTPSVVEKCRSFHGVSCLLQSAHSACNCQALLRTRRRPRELRPFTSARDIDSTRCHSLKLAQSRDRIEHSIEG